MEIEGKNVLVLGAYGEAGIAICRQILRYLPAELVLASLTEQEAQWALKELAPETPSYCRVMASWGNVFVRWFLKDMRIADIVASKEHLRTVVDDNLNELTDDILSESTLYRLITEHRPEIVIDCINTATALSYQNIYHTYEARNRGGTDPTDAAAVLYQLLSATSIPPLIRHLQILYESMKKAGTRLYLKIGTTGTGGMGLNIPFTHGEENPSRLLMAKAATAGAHTMLLYTLSKTPGWPIVKEIKPAAMIGWKDIGKGIVRRGNRTYPLYDCRLEEAYRLTEGSTFSYDQLDTGCSLEGKELEGVYIDTGENGVFSIDEFKAITSLGLMEFVTPEDIAHHTIMNIIGVNSSKDVIAAIDNAVMEPTFRAGILRRDAIEEATRLGGGGLAYGFLGPKMSKLVTECKLIKQSYGTVEDALSVSPERLAYSLEKLLEVEPDLRNACVSIGIPVLLPDGLRLLFARRAVKEKGWEEEPWTISPENIEKWAQREWVDLRPSNMAHWQERFQKASEDACRYPDKHCSRFNRGMLFWKKTEEGKTIIDAGEITAWVFIHEFGGGRPHAYAESKEMVYF
ncbi:MAG: hypothetical protein KA801_11025 [Syntrophorhabdaceae bacterium]|nr:hypothetical protein [Syntrophorhabdaceae bacterium]